MASCPRCGAYTTSVSGLCDNCQSSDERRAAEKASRDSASRQREAEKKARQNAKIEADEKWNADFKDRIHLMDVYKRWYDRLTPEEQAQAKADYGTEAEMLGKARQILREDEEWAIKQDRIEREEAYNKPENVLKRQKKEKWEKSFLRRFLSNTWDVVKWLIIIGIIIFIFRWLFPGTFNNIVNWITGLFK